VIRETAFIH